MVYGKYVGSYNSLNPGNASSYGELFTGYELTAGKIGSTTNPNTANQVNEVIARMNEGTKTVELVVEKPVFEQTPQEQFREVRRLAKLANVTPTMHAPIIDPSGFERAEEEGGAAWSENARKEAEKYLLDSIRRVRDANPEGSFNVTIHASAMPALETKWMTEGGKQKEVPMKQYVVNVEDGSVAMIKRQELFKPQEGTEMKAYAPAELIDKYNEKIWNSSMMSLVDAKRVTDMHYGDIEYKRKAAEEIEEAKKEGILFTPEQEKELGGRERVFRGELIAASQYYDQMQNQIETMYNQLQKDIANRKTELKKMEDENARREKEKEIEKMSGILSEISREWQEKKPLLEKYKEQKKDWEFFEEKKKMIDRTIPKMDEIKHISPQKILVPLEEFAKDKTAETFSNIALKTYKEWGDKAPIISIENWQPNIAFSRADQLKGLIEESREMFVEKAMKGGITKEKAQKAAERMIGATWDIAHINMLRKYGFPESEIIKETEKIAPYVKKMHLVDNFGYEDAHLPVGMGNVPFKKIMETMKEEKFTGPIISEAFTFPQHFRISPHVYELEALNVPLNYPAFGGPSVGEARELFGSYFTGYGTFLPEQHFAMYGGGFSGLPLELGGKVATGKSSAFSGTPMD